MAQVETYEEIRAGRRREFQVPDGSTRWNTAFMSAQRAGDPQAFLAENSPGRVLRTHFHGADQFQIIFEGDGVLGRHALTPSGVHFARAYTPYGPIVCGDKGLSFVTLRGRKDMVGASFLPASRALLEAAEREPWQATEVPDFAALRPGADGAAMRQLGGLQDGRGLAVYALSLAPGARMPAPAAAGSDGQFVVVTHGEIVHEGRARSGLTVAYVASGEPAFQLHAGPAGLQAIVLNFPRPGQAEAAGRAGAGVMRCVLCAFEYDEAAGIPAEGIPPGTRWADVPEDFLCPDCSAGKAEFEAPG